MHLEQEKLLEARAALQAQPRAQVMPLSPWCGVGLSPHVPLGFSALFPGKPPRCSPDTLPSASRLSTTLKKQVLPLVAQAPPDICAWRSITTIPWCSKVRGWVVLPTAFPVRAWQESWGNSREGLIPSGEASGLNHGPVLSFVES